MRYLREFKNQIVLNECSTIDDLITYYFVAPKEILSHYIDENYSNAIGACISIDFPKGVLKCHRNADFMMTPIEKEVDYYGKEYFIETDWRNVYLTQDDYDVLFELVNVNKKGDQELC